MAYGTISRILILPSPENRKSSINKIYDILKMNGYPNQLIKQLINKSETNMIAKMTNMNTSTNNDNQLLKYKGLTYTPQKT